jgi:glutathione S-transferase
MKLYHCHNARSFRVLWALEELGIGYELVMLPFPPRQLEPDYLEVNPLGTVPALVDGAVRMTESAAICHYLAQMAGSPLSVGPQEEAYPVFLNWLHFGEATLTFPQTIVLRYERFEPEETRNFAVGSDYRRWFLSRLRAVEAALGDRSFLCADRFTVADISVGYALMLGATLGLDSHYHEHVSAYWERLQDRTGFQLALASQGPAGAS